jgi:uncharacterized protein YndB with AHSA1/START domain
MRFVLMGVAAVVGLVVIVVLIGLTRPKSHAARTQARLSLAPEEVWATVSDFEHWAEWNPDVKRVDALPDPNGHRVMNVVGSWGEARTEVTTWQPPNRMVTSMDAGGFRGRWTYDLAPSSDGGTVLTVTEEGEVDNPVFRAMMIFHDNYATMMAYHRALATRLGESVVPSKVEITQAR